MPRAVRKAAKRGGDDLARDAAEFYEALSALLRAYQFRDRDRACDQGLSVTGCYALDFVVREGPLSVNELAKRLRVDKSSASRLAADLEAKGHLVREGNPEDGRAWKLTATAAGRAVNGKIRRGIVARQQELLAGLDPAVRAGVIELLQRLTRLELERQECRPCG